MEKRNMPDEKSLSIKISLFSLLTSASTLVCCALPALMVTLGAGAALAGFVSSFPALIFLSKYKIYVFIVAGIFLLVAGILQWRGRYAPCPTDPLLAKSCMRLRRISLAIYVFSVIIYTVGFFFAFLAARFFF